VHIICKAAGLALLFSSAAVLSGCGTLMVTGAVVGTTVSAGMLATDLAVGAGVLAIEGTGAVIEGTGKLVGAAMASPEPACTTQESADTTRDPAAAAAECRVD
jgi:hypothetical protein